MAEDSRQLLDGAPEEVEFRGRALNFHGMLDTQTLIPRHAIAQSGVARVDPEGIEQWAIAGRAPEKQLARDAEEDPPWEPRSQERHGDENSTNEERADALPVVHIHTEPPAMADGETLQECRSHNEVFRTVASKRTGENGVLPVLGPGGSRNTDMPARSKKQQMAAGAALAAKRGQRSKCSLKGASRQPLTPDPIQSWRNAPR
jgi:hypothetical protein